jgi:hypothetical protein
MYERRARTGAAAGAALHLPWGDGAVKRRPDSLPDVDMSTHRHRAGRLTLGFRMALLPALLAAAVTFLLVGPGRYGLGVAESLVVAALVAVAIAIPVDRMGARPARRGARRGGRR